jgi:YidC/Oxa1 family membrane protein insertase
MAAASLPAAAGIASKPLVNLVLQKEWFFVCGGYFVAVPAHPLATTPFPRDILSPDMFNTILIEPLTFALSSIAPVVGSYGWAIILVTLIIRALLIPLTLPSMKMAAKMRDLQPEIDKLKKLHGKDKVALQQAQLKLFQEHNLNPASGCLPNILQFVILIALYQVFNAVARNGNGSLTSFFWLDISRPDPLYILPIIAGATQLILGLMILPAADASAEQSLAAVTKTKKDDKPAEDLASMAQSMQQQMVYMMPIMTLFFALTFPAGLTLYWVTTTVFSLAQQYFVSGWGGLPLAIKKLTRTVYGNR